MASQTNVDFVITPATWSDYHDRLEKTAAGLLNLVGWFGSTHSLATWRKEVEFLEVFQEEEIYGFDPQIDEWDPSFVAIEAEVLAKASVLIIRLENNELLNGSLGSIAEIGMALTSATLRGQIVIISIEDNLLTSLDEPGAIAQYMVLEMSLDNFLKIPELARFFHIHRGDDLEALATIACEAAHQQMNVSLDGLDFDGFLKKREQRRQHRPLHVTLSGSGGPYTTVHNDVFWEKRRKLSDPCLAKGYHVKDLSSGAIGKAWDIPYGSLDKIATALAMRTLLTIELEYNQEADLLLAPIMSESASKAGITWIGFVLCQALTTGQDIKIFLEPFDPVDYIDHKLATVELVELRDATDEKLVRERLHLAGVPDKVLALATQTEVLATGSLLHRLSQPDLPTFNEVKKSLLGQTEIFQQADNARRVRTLIQGHLERMYHDERFPDFFYYANKIS